jgi:hypothetical protein
MSSHRSESFHERLLRAVRTGFLSAFDFGTSVQDELGGYESARDALRKDAEKLAQDARKVTGDLRKAEQQVHGQT